MGKYWDVLTDQERQNADYLFATQDEEAFEEYFEELLRHSYFNERTYAVFRATLEKIDEEQEARRYEEERKRLLPAALAWKEKCNQEAKARGPLDLFEWESPRGVFIKRTIVPDLRKLPKLRRCTISSTKTECGT